MKSRCREHSRVMYKQVLGGRGQGMKSCLAKTRDQPHGMCVWERAGNEVLPCQHQGSAPWDVCGTKLGRNNHPQLRHG